MKNNVKRLLALILALAMSLSLFACGQKQDGKQDDVQERRIPPVCSPTPAGARSLCPRTCRRWPYPARWPRWWCSPSPRTGWWAWPTLGTRRADVF